MYVFCKKCQDYKEVKTLMSNGKLASLFCTHMVLVDASNVKYSLVEEVKEEVFEETKPFTQEEVEEGIRIIEEENPTQDISSLYTEEIEITEKPKEEVKEVIFIPPNAHTEYSSYRALKEQLIKAIAEHDRIFNEAKTPEIVEVIPELKGEEIIPIPEVKEELTLSPEVLEELKVEVEKEPEFNLTPFDTNRFHNRKTYDTPYPFQEKGIQFAIDNQFKVLIADEQGLGKTVQALGVMFHAWNDEKLRDEFFPVLVTAKSSIKMQWLVQMLNWGGMDFVPQIIDDGKVPPIEGFNVYIASYDIFRRFTKEKKVTKTSEWGHEIHTTKKENPFYDFPFKTIIMDEVQAIKGESQRTSEVKRIAKGKNVIALSGTPIKNNAAEYYTILNLLNPNKFPTRQGYIDRWVRVELINGYEKMTGIKNPEAFAQYTSDMVIRRTRDEVKDEIGLRVTAANRIFYHVDFESPKLKAAYQNAEAEFIREMEDNTKAKNPIEIIGRLSVMRHLVGLNKIQPTVDLAIEFLLENPSGKLVIFAHHEDVMNAIYKLLSNWCIDGNYEVPLIYHSGLTQGERFEMIQNFAENTNKKGKKIHIPILIGSTLAMGEGVDRLQEVCNDCIIAERQWNPANEEQAESRLVRIGQKREFVNATYPIATNTIDEYFTEIVEVKRKAMKETLDGKSQAAWDETSLMVALYDAIVSKGRSRKTKKGW